MPRVRIVAGRGLGSTGGPVVGVGGTGINDAMTQNGGGGGGTPGAPVLSGAQEGGDFDFSTHYVIIQVTAPLSDGGSPVIDYEILYYGSTDGGATYTVLEETQIATTTGSKSQTQGTIFWNEHQIRVRARNANGYGTQATATCTGTIAGGV